MLTVGKANQTFSAAHRLHGHKGKCASLHGHNYAVTVAVRGDPAANMLIDFCDLKTYVKAVTDCLDHGTILHNEDPLHAAISVDSRTLLITLQEPPTVEAISRWIWRELSDRLRGVNGVTLHKLTLFETSDSYAEISEHDLCSGTNSGSQAAQSRCGCAARNGGA